MGGTHKRNMRAEKAKVKLKGAKLPKGLNVTKTDFKVRKIMIREQLKESQYIDGQRKLDLKETLSHLKHHSNSFRTGALRNLRESLAAGNANHLLGHLSELIQGIVAMCLDLEREVRRESYRTLSCLFGILESATIAPFFHVISSYLRCAMTHIQVTVQEDALLLLDVLLQHVPKLLVSHSTKIFQNFLEMISRVRADGNRASRTLTVHMGQQQTTIKWRTKVLLRLQQMFATLVEQKTKSHNGSQAKTAEPLVATFNPKEPQHFGILRRYTSAPCDLSAIFCRTVGATNISSIGTDTLIESADESLVLRKYVEHLMPLLLESWLEVRPQAASKNEEILLSHDAAVTLKIALEIIEHLWALIARHEISVNNNELSSWLCHEYADVFVVNFLSNSFPYQQHSAQKPNTKKNKRAAAANNSTNDTSSGGTHCMPQNLSLVLLTCRFYAKPGQRQADNFAALLAYLETIVSKLHVPHALPIDCQRQLVQALHALLFQTARPLQVLFAQPMRQLMHATIGALLRNEFSTRDGVAASLLVLLCEIVQDPKLYVAYGGAAAFTELLIYLPQLLLKPSISKSTLVAMSHLGKQQNQIFLKALAQQVSGVVANIQSIQVNGACNAFEGKKHIMNLFYWTKRDWASGELLTQLSAQVTDKRIVSYFRFILSE